MTPHYRNILILTIIGVTLSFAVYVIAPPVDAVPQIAQGDDVYLGEYADLSLALSWPDYAVAWCKNAYPGCLPPDQVITIDSFQHNVFIDPEKFHPGWYYRWDGKWNNGENFYAFRVRVGERPKDNSTVNITPTPTPTIPGVDVKGNGPFEWIIAKGDSPDIQFTYVADEGICGTGSGNDEAHLWLFGSTEMLMDIPLETVTNGTYELPLSAKDTEGLSTGTYTGYIQFPAANGRQDVFWEPVERCLDTPYDDKFVPDQAINERNPAGTKVWFEKMVHNVKYSDDLLVPITMEVKDPQIIITDITQGEEKMWITGITTWSGGTEITVRLDPDNYALTSEKRAHTWTTKVAGSLVEWRKFDLTVPIEMKDMYLGTHELVMSVDKNNYVTNVYHNFKVTGTFIMPTPTPEFVKYVTDVNGKRISAVNITPAPTVAVTTVPTTDITYISTLTVATTSPTPVPTTVAPVRTTPNITLPLNPIMGLLALCVAWLVMRR